MGKGTYFNKATFFDIEQKKVKKIPDKWTNIDRWDLLQQRCLTLTGILGPLGSGYRFQGIDGVEPCAPMIFIGDLQN